VRALIAGFALGAGVITPSLAAEMPSAGTVSPAALVAAEAQGFYTAYRTLPVGGVPDEKGRAKLEPFITPALDKLLIDADSAEAHYAQATHNESPPLLENDPFTSLFEGATGFQVGACTVADKTGKCAINLVHDDKKEKPVKWIDTADFVLTDKGWRLDDIEYGGNWEFGLKGKLSDVLKSVIEEAKKPAE